MREGRPAELDRRHAVAGAPEAALEPRGRSCDRTRGWRRLPSSARSPLAAFLRSQRAVTVRASARAEAHAPAHRASFPTDRVCFTPATLLSFRLQGLAPGGDRSLSPGSLLPCRSRFALWRARRLRRFDPSAEGDRSDRGRPDLLPSWRFPLWGSPSRRRRAGFPAPPLPRFSTERASGGCASESSLAAGAVSRPSAT